MSEFERGFAEELEKLAYRVKGVGTFVGKARPKPVIRKAPTPLKETDPTILAAVEEAELAKQQQRAKQIAAMYKAMQPSTRVE